MARYKESEASAGQGLFLTVNLKEQLLPGTFEHMLDDLVGGKIDIRVFDENYKNDKTGAPAIPPGALMKLVIYGYSKGIKSSRGLDEMARKNIVAKALVRDMEVHWTTIADFISGNGEKFQKVFVEVLAYCGELELIGGETFAIDGLRLPSNASIDMSGTEKELEKRVSLYRQMAEKHMEKHRKLDAAGDGDKERKRNYEERQKHLERQINKISNFLLQMEKKPGKHVEEVKSNVTDNESAMIYSGGEYIQGYIGIAVSDKKNQIIVNAEAVGTANEGGHLPGLLDRTKETLEAAGVDIREGTKQTILADANYFSEENLAACQERGVEAVIPGGERKAREGKGGENIFGENDFIYNEAEQYYECPNGKRLEYRYESKLGEIDWKVYQASVKDCRPCPLLGRCIRTKKEPEELERGRKLLIRKGGGLCDLMRKKMKAEEYQNIYAYRIQIVEPVFANISYCKSLNRFMLRGNKKVNGQWRLYCMVHNLGKCLSGYNEGRGYTALMR